MNEKPPRLTLAEIGRRQFDVIEPGVSYRLSVPGQGVSFTVDRLVWRYAELSGKLSVAVDFNGTDAIDGALSVATFNLSSARARTERASLLERQSRASDIPWQPLIEELCQRVLTAERTGDPALVLRDVERQSEDERTVRVSGFLLPWKHPSCLFGDGGACKSYLALCLGGLLAQEGHRVALFDWELDAADHRERLGRLFGADMPDTFFYTRCSRPLVHEVDRLKRIVRAQHIDFAVFDSIGFACHEAPETAEGALGYYRAQRQIGIGSLNLAHVNRGETSDTKPFGSVFHYNSVRSAWNIKATEDGAGHLTLGVFQRKANLYARQQPFSLEATFTDDRTTFRRGEIADVETFAPQISVLQRVRAILRAGAMTREQLAAELGDQKPETLRRKINQAIERGDLVRFPGSGGTEQIGLAARQAS